jgi:hypothetical protein
MQTRLAHAVEKQGALDAIAIDVGRLGTTETFITPRTPCWPACYVALIVRRVRQARERPGRD